MRFELAFGCARGAIVGAGGEGWLGVSTPVDSDKQNLMCRLVLASAYSHANYYTFTSCQLVSQHLKYMHDDVLM